MPSKKFEPTLRPFEFRLTSEQKRRFVRFASEEGISLSELNRRAICDYSSSQETKNIIARLPQETSP